MPSGRQICNALKTDRTKTFAAQAILSDVSRHPEDVAYEALTACLNPNAPNPPQRVLPISLNSDERNQVKDVLELLADSTVFVLPSVAEPYPMIALEAAAVGTPMVVSTQTGVSGILEAEEFATARRMPTACAGCPCRGGCAGRRALIGNVDASDPYCPFARGERIVLDWERGARQDWGYGCGACPAPGGGQGGSPRADCAG